MDKMLIGNVVFDDVDTSDCPDFSDAHICYAEYDCVPMSDDELNAINEDRGFVHEQLMMYLY